MQRHPIFARLYDFYIIPQGLWGVQARRRSVVAGAAGKVLDLGVGTGLNFPLYRNCEVVGLDPDPHMIRQARRRAEKALVPVRVLLGRAEALPFPDESFDMVIATLVFATIEKPALAAREVRRVLRPDGSFRFFEHYRSKHRLLAGVQDRVTPLWRRFLGGCEPNRDILRIFAEAGLDVLGTRKLRGTFLLHGVARPSARRYPPLAS